MKVLGRPLRAGYGSRRKRRAVAWRRLRSCLRRLSAWRSLLSDCRMRIRAMAILAMSNHLPSAWGATKAYSPLTEIRQLNRAGPAIQGQTIRLSAACAGFRLSPAFIAQFAGCGLGGLLSIV